MLSYIISTFPCASQPQACPRRPGSARPPRPAPQSKASWYYRLVQQAASWGVVVVQYDTPAFSFVTVAAEVALFPFLAQVCVCACPFACARACMLELLLLSSLPA